METKDERGRKFSEKVEADLARRAHLYFALPGDRFHSAAYKEIVSDGVAVPVLLVVLFKQPIPPNSKERKRLQKANLWPPKPVPFSFPQREARHHGLTEKGLAKGLKALQRVGFIDLVHQGSATRGDYSLYIVSERWRRWGVATFEKREWPESRVSSIRDKGTGKFARRREGKLRANKTLVAAISAAKREEMTAIAAAKHPRIAASLAVNNA